MATQTDTSLFSWNSPQQLPRLWKLVRLLDILPYQPLVDALCKRRGRGRNDFPPEPMLRLVIAGTVLQYTSAASLLRNLQINLALAQICGFSPLPRQQRSTVTVHQHDDGTVDVEQVDYAQRITLPDDCAFSRFLGGLLEVLDERDYFREMFEQLRDELTGLVPDFGRYLAYDGKAIRSHSTGRVNQKTGRTSDPDATWGRHETKGVDKNGNAWTKVKIWFGYRLHAIVDSVSELPVDYRVTTATDAETGALADMIDGLSGTGPDILRNAEQLSADRGLDAIELYRKLYDDHGVDPVIDNRNLWREEKGNGDYDPQKPILRMLNGGRSVDNILYAEDGTVYCRCPKSGEERLMCFMGHEKDRGTLKYRCPARAGGYECEGMAECLENGSSRAHRYGRTVRIKVTDSNRRIFTPTPRGTYKWRRSYARRTAAERFFSRVGQGFCFDHHYVRGLKRMKVKASLAMVIALALAIVHIEAGQPQNMRSLICPLALPGPG